jgi:subtilisin family serine protease
MDELGIVLATSSDVGFKSKIEQLSDVQKVLPDLQFNFLRATVKQKKVQQLAAEVPSSQLSSSTDLGLTGTNPLVPLQWNLLAVNAKEAFVSGNKGNGAVVAVLDNGFYLDNPDLSPNIIASKSKSFVPGETVQFQSTLYYSHGTLVSGIIAAADNDYGIAGIAPSAKLMLVKVLTEEGSGQFGWVIEGVYYAANNGADIINMSLGALIPRNGRFIADDGGTPNDPSDDVIVNEASDVQDLITALNRAFQYARKKGVVSIAAAGNEYYYATGQGQGTSYPANCEDVLAISATGPTGWAVNPNTTLSTPSSYTNYGSSLIDFAAPGGDVIYPGNENATIIGITRPAWYFDMVYSNDTQNGFAWAAGTSMASPAAAAVAALIAGKYGGNISPAQLEAKMKSSAVNVGSRQYYGNGLVNAGNAIKQ